MAQDANTRCPYTQQEMKNPVTNKHCNHNYDRDGIMELIKTRGPRAKLVSHKKYRFYLSKGAS